MTLPTVHISAPARLHFGLLSFNRPSGRDHGGIGMMLREPRTEVRISPADHLSVLGPQAERAESFARLWSKQTGQPVRATIEIERAIPAHAGLGSGTQMGLAVAEGLSRLAGIRATMSLGDVADSVQRANRSSVGTYGFANGGWIAEWGSRPDERLGQLERRVEFPQAWRVVLMRIANGEGLSGPSESTAFAELPPVAAVITDRLMSLVRESLLPACESADFRMFSRTLYEYGVTAGDCFAAIQGGPFASPRLAEIVAMVRRLGIEGVGQSSWGPTVFAMVANEEGAKRLQRELVAAWHGPTLEFVVTEGDNHGAVIQQFDWT